MASSSMSESFLLATYSSSSRGKQPQNTSPLFASTSQKSKNGTDSFVTVAKRSDGVHVLDVSKLQPVISHSLGPSSAFACAPLTLRASSSDKCYTYAVKLDSTSSSDSGRRISVWEDDLSSPSAEESVRTSEAVVAEKDRIHSIHHAEGLGIIVVSGSGKLSLVDAQTLDIQSLSIPSSVCEAGDVLYVSSPKNKERTVTLAVVSSKGNKAVQLKVLSIDDACAVSVTSESEVPVSPSRLAGITFSDSEVLSLLEVDGTWHTYKAPTTQETSLSPLTRCLHLSGFNLTGPKPSLTTLSLSSSHVLLAGLSADSSELILQIWDLQLSVVLASSSLPLPAALTSAPPQLQLVTGSQVLNSAQTQIHGQAILLISSSPKEASAKSTSLVYVTPYAVPTLSTIAAAMGRGAQTKKWLREEQKPQDQAHTNVLSAIKTAVQGARAQAASAAFSKWTQANEKAPALDYNFVKELLDVALVLPSNSQAYASDIVHYLLENKVVCSAMIPAPNTLLGLLRARSDWKGVDLAFQNVNDLSESEIVETLQVVAVSHRSKPEANDENAMQVDSGLPGTAAPPLVAFLNIVVHYPTSRVQMTNMVKKYFKDATDLTNILKVLDGWLVRWSKMDLKLLVGRKELKRNEQGVWVVAGRKGDKQKKMYDMPSLGKIIDFTQIILDSSFLALLQHPPASKTLRSIQAHLDPEVRFTSVAEGIRGALEPFLHAQQKALKESLIPEDVKEKERQKGDWRQRRKQLNANIGPYTLEEILL